MKNNFKKMKNNLKKRKTFFFRKTKVSPKNRKLENLKREKNL